jgi:uncharacterized membrane protein YdfJ with MMPL/SSD domain
VHPTAAIISWIQLTIFAFLFGLSMDDEVFMVSRMREAYDGGDHLRRHGDPRAARAVDYGCRRALELVVALLVRPPRPSPEESG